MSIFNPVIGADNPNCRCKDCYHGFWLRTLPLNELKCYCELLHAIIGTENVFICTGAEDDIHFSPEFKKNVACVRCENSLWYRTSKNIFRCYCLHLQCVVFDSADKKISPIADCNGVSALQELNDFPQATNLDEF